MSRLADRRALPAWVTAPLAAVFSLSAVLSSYLLWGWAGVMLVCSLMMVTGCLIQEGVRNILRAADEIVANHFDNKRD